jgi:hypothetical protein
MGWALGGSRPVRMPDRRFGLAGSAAPTQVISNDGNTLANDEDGELILTDDNSIDIVVNW